MSAVTKYYCDKCKKEVLQKDLLNIRIEIKGYGGKNQCAYHDVCPTCAVKIGFIRQEIKYNEIVNDIKTTPEQLYDIISQIVWENTPQRER